MKERPIPRSSTSQLIDSVSTFLIFRLWQYLEFQVGVCVCEILID